MSSIFTCLFKAEEHNEPIHKGSHVVIPCRIVYNEDVPEGISTVYVLVEVLHEGYTASGIIDNIPCNVFQQCAINPKNTYFRLISIQKEYKYLVSEQKDTKTAKYKIEQSADVYDYMDGIYVNYFSSNGKSIVPVQKKHSFSVFNLENSGKSTFQFIQERVDPYAFLSANFVVMLGCICHHGNNFYKIGFVHLRKKRDILYPSKHFMDADTNVLANNMDYSKAYILNNTWATENSENNNAAKFMIPFLNFEENFVITWLANLDTSSYKINDEEKNVSEISSFMKSILERAENFLNGRSFPGLEGRIPDDMAGVFRDLGFELQRNFGIDFIIREECKIQTASS